MREKVILLHYHLRTGGVTRVIDHQVKALQALNYEPIICIGEPTEATFDCEIQVHPVLQYGIWDFKLTEIEELILSFEPSSIWWVHNSTLGKNASVPILCNLLAEQSTRVIVQNHDYAEDGRQQNYANIRKFVIEKGYKLYPISNQLIYVSINSRDQDYLIQSGCPNEQSAILPNAVVLPEVENEVKKHDHIIYPTRAIRRKNIGELILWSIIIQDVEFDITLSPKNPEQLIFYKKWIDFIDKNPIQNVNLEAGSKITQSFSEYLAGSKSIISTSINEGFGQAYLEPWLISSSLVGRSLDFLKHDFEKEGVQLNHLYSELKIPTHTFNFSDFIVRQKNRAIKLANYYNVDSLTYNLESTLSEIDFGALDEQAQSESLTYLLTDSQLQSDLKNMWESMLSESYKYVESNRTIIKEKFGADAYQDRIEKLLGSFDGLKKSPNTDIKAEKMLDLFLSGILKFPLKSTL